LPDFWKRATRTLLFLKDVEPPRRAAARQGHSPKILPTMRAVIGMVGRFPGADNLEQLWRNLCNAKESISFLKPEN